MKQAIVPGRWDLVQKIRKIQVTQAKELAYPRSSVPGLKDVKRTSVMNMVCYLEDYSPRAGPHYIRCCTKKKVPA